MNDIYIEKYYKQRLLGMQKEVVPMYTREQIEELEKKLKEINNKN